MGSGRPEEFDQRPEAGSDPGSVDDSGRAEAVAGAPASARVGVSAREGDELASASRVPPVAPPNARLFWTLMLGVMTADVVTKALAERELRPMHFPRAVMGDWFRLTLVYNRGAAFGFDLGPYSRWIFLVLTLLALVILGRLFRATRPEDVRRTVALGLVCGGAIGNLIDRVRSPAGVVDFLDIGLSDNWRWPTFNVADVAVSVGAFLLAWALWGEDENMAAESPPVAIPVERTGT